MLPRSPVLRIKVRASTCTEYLFNNSRQDTKSIMATSTSPVPLAIIGVAYRAPGVGRKGLVEFLTEARSAFSLVPKDRFDHESFYHNDSAKPGALAVKGAYFLPDDIYAFDAPFFNITPEEAASMDPQLREHKSTART